MEFFQQSEFLKSAVLWNQPLYHLDSGFGLKSYLGGWVAENKPTWKGSRRENRVMAKGYDMLCVFTSSGAKWKEKKMPGCTNEWVKREQTSVTAYEASWDKHRRGPSRIKEQIQMAGAACRAALDRSFNGTGQQGACVSSKGKRTALCTPTLKETTRVTGGADGRG